MSWLVMVKLEICHVRLRHGRLFYAAYTSYRRIDWSAVHIYSTELRRSHCNDRNLMCIAAEISLNVEAKSEEIENSKKEQ